MSDSEKIINKLKIIGIISNEQLEKDTNVDYWWKLKYRKIQLSKINNVDKALIKINNARDFLHLYDLNYLKKILNQYFSIKEDLSTNNQYEQENFDENYENNTNSNYEQENFDEIYEISTNSNYEQENFDEKGKNTNIRIRNLLKMLGITSKDQLNEKDINYWWRKRYVYLKHENYPLDEKNKDLIILNNIKDELSKYSLNFIKSFL